ncbi:hypothetical protein J3Q64DRAFT_1696829 [Phycomyces blakesleeanus]|uniref:Uncharacterized protein n=2 Tax=Phycomyces blakesleeanus TaxID=4837 RepID=A0A162Q0Q9_PHYB8|nr:hypothetical protein PHYBLDRAFT_166098 [Phycomyces blakesleeanus NRRL 1555(-)]OAD76126.1 hypothetical protein PHYBLDRAFT_166098 [Phycomyces blakesleeanus NRRL 1555(-)]|eukprot:XP_018294166.1 hypothetical protein PHYBLDRAFT_166098 [Phycomyces blakesleeanus NRRL 1555(-)]
MINTSIDQNSLNIIRQSYPLTLYKTSKARKIVSLNGFISNIYTCVCFNTYLCAVFLAQYLAVISNIVILTAFEPTINFKAHTHIAENLGDIKETLRLRNDIVSLNALL